MTNISDNWTLPGNQPKTLTLRQVPAPALTALARGDLAGAQEFTDVYLPAYMVSPECTSVWLRREQQIAASPDDAPWVTRLIVDLELNTVVGRAGFHGPPDATGMVEVGYSVDPEFRRQGYARSALAIMLHVAATDQSAKTVRATISPENTPSRSLVQEFGFLENGEQWDEEDGLEIIFEVMAASS